MIKIPPKKVLKRYAVIIAIAAALVFLLWKNKTLLIVATVNGQPVPRWELESRMVSRFGSQTLDEVINEQIIFQEGRKKGVRITDAQVATKVAEIEKSLNGQITLKDALAGQGMTMEEFQSQVKLQLTLEKLAASDLSVTEKEVEDYVASNSATLTATDAAGLKAEARTILESQKKNEALRQLFTNLKSQARIVKYL